MANQVGNSMARNEQPLFLDAGRLIVQYHAINNIEYSSSSFPFFLLVLTDERNEEINNEQTVQLTGNQVENLCEIGLYLLMGDHENRVAFSAFESV